MIREGLLDKTVFVIDAGDHLLIDAHLNRLAFICAGHIAQTF